MDKKEFEMISCKHTVGTCVKNGKHSIVERCRRVTITNGLTYKDNQ